MPTFIQTVSFRSQMVFEPASDDPVVNRVLEDVRAQGGEIEDVRHAMAGNFGAFVATYLIRYQASQPIQLQVVPKAGIGGTYLLIVLLGVAALIGLLLALAGGILAG